MRRIPLVLWGGNVLLSGVQIMTHRASAVWVACWLVLLTVNVFLVGKYSDQWFA